MCQSQESQGEEHSHAERVSQKITGNPGEMEKSAFYWGLPGVVRRQCCPWMALSLLQLALYTGGEPAPSSLQSVINYLSKTPRRCVWRQRLVLWWLQTGGGGAVSRWRVLWEWEGRGGGGGGGGAQWAITAQLSLSDWGQVYQRAESASFAFTVQEVRDSNVNSWKMC